MITGEVKNRIDQIWDAFWTGGITNSIDVLEQMTYLFFIKMLDDTQIRQEASASIFGTKLMDAVFKDGDWRNPDNDKAVPYRNLRWSVFKDFESDAMFKNVRDNVFVFIKNLSSGKESAYARYMNNAAFKIPSSRVLVKIVDGIDSLDMNDRDTMGDVYEYVLGKMAASGNNGQFRTPRHIIRMMVQLMHPTLNDEMCDPAMGSAGFIVETAKFVAENFAADLLKAENMKHYKSSMFNGFDTDQTMLRIGAMNLMLHGVDAPNIAYRDSLSTDNADAEQYSLILANPPFSGSLDNAIVSKSLLAIAPTKKTELLFLALFVRSLQVGGRCASIVPDGVLFGNSKGHKAIRKELVENQRLQAVISMPSGVFQPYSGVSTAILVFTKTNAGGTDRVWFYEMKADGFSLDQKRMPVEDNDIPDMVARFAHLDSEASRARKEQSFLVPVEEIRANDYDLSINKYKEVERVKVEYDAPEAILQRIESLENQITEEIKNYKRIVGDGKKNGMC
ncbi:MAG: SAM-dependent DNA methyltransferase [Fibrobacter sp.]|nr:SAM-dependent DNA methyltransferase [Fibrobacter sp.]